MNQRGFASIIRVLIIVVLAGVIGYFALTSNKKSAVNIETLNSFGNTNTALNTGTLPDTNSVADVNISTNTNSATNPTVGWKTHTDSTSNFSFRYPSDVTLITAVDGVFPFCSRSSCYTIERSAVTNQDTRETFWEDDQKIGTFQNSAINGVIYARSSSRAITVILTSSFELHVIKYGPDGGGVGPSATKDTTFNAVESSVKLKDQLVY